MIDAIGVDAYPPPGGQGSETEQHTAAAGQAPAWQYSSFPSQAARWAVDGIAKAGTIGAIGVYPAGIDISRWIDQARSEELPRLHASTRGLKLDRQAVDAALNLTFHNGHTEGVNTKTKLIKRQMYGRASFNSSATASSSANTTQRHHRIWARAVRSTLPDCEALL